MGDSLQLPSRAPAWDGMIHVMWVTQRAAHWAEGTSRLVYHHHPRSLLRQLIISVANKAEIFSFLR